MEGIRKKRLAKKEGVENWIGNERLADWKPRFLLVHWKCNSALKMQQICRRLECFLKFLLLSLNLSGLFDYCCAATSGCSCGWWWVDIGVVAWCVQPIAKRSDGEVCWCWSFDSLFGGQLNAAVVKFGCDVGQEGTSKISFKTTGSDLGSAEILRIRVRFQLGKGWK